MNWLYALDQPRPEGEAGVPGDDNWGWEFRVEDFVYARIVEDEAAAAGLPDDGLRQRLLAHLAASRAILVEHSIYVGKYRSSGRCVTCEPIHGVPCLTVIALARAWQDHPDAPDWLARDTNRPDADVLVAGTWRRHRWPQTIPETTT